MCKEMILNHARKIKQEHYNSGETMNSISSHPINSSNPARGNQGGRGGGGNCGRGSNGQPRGNQSSN